MPLLIRAGHGLVGTGDGVLPRMADGGQVEVVSASHGRLWVIGHGAVGWKFIQRAGGKYSGHSILVAALCTVVDGTQCRRMRPVNIDVLQGLIIIGAQTADSCNCRGGECRTWRHGYGTQLRRAAIAEVESPGRAGSVGV